MYLIITVPEQERTVKREVQRFFEEQELAAKARHYKDKCGRKEGPRPAKSVRAEERAELATTGPSRMSNSKNLSRMSR